MFIYLLQYIFIYIYHSFISERDAQKKAATSSSSSSSSARNTSGQTKTDTASSSSSSAANIPTKQPCPVIEKIIDSDEEAAHFAEDLGGREADQAEQEERNVEKNMETLFASDENYDSSSDDNETVDDIMTQLQELEDS